MSNKLIWLGQCQIFRRQKCSC